MTTDRAGGFAGELGLVGLFDITQLLVLNRATGVLTVTADRRGGSLYFQDGRLVNAVDDARAEGENAAYRVFAFREGRFEFRAEPPSGKALIEQSTESVMLEAARRMDEAAAEEGEPEPRQAERLKETQTSLEALRDVFKSLARETGAALASGGISVTHLFGIREPDDRVLLRPGQPTRLRVDGAWIPGYGRPLSREDYQQVQGELIAASAPEEPGATRPRTRRLTLASGVVVRITVLDEIGAEALWIRPIQVPAPSPDTLVVETNALGTLLDRHDGIALVTAPTSADARRALHALIAERDRRRSDAVVVIGPEPAYTHHASSGVVLQLAPADAAARLPSLEPLLVGLEPDVDPAVLAVAPAQAPWWVAVAGPDPASAACRWALRAGIPERHSALGVLAALPVTLVDVTPSTEGTLECQMRALGEPERAMWLSGDAAGLYAALARGEGHPALRVLDGGR
ncbi:MAG TPA: DUF4388 domain-containing protein [Dongiaceae bacterium]|nr:DUF4388 domain-containing protein [Dongiaceae bacterium]